MKCFALVTLLILAACASPPAIYLHPKAKIEIVSGGQCQIVENMTSHTIVPAPLEVDQSYRLDDGVEVVRSSPCAK